MVDYTLGNDFSTKDLLTKLFSRVSTRYIARYKRGGIFSARCEALLTKCLKNPSCEVIKMKDERRRGKENPKKRDG